ncbi:MAG: DUF4838 domain-containing protein [Verrucomicrobiota bacterium]
MRYAIILSLLFLSPCLRAGDGAVLSQPGQPVKLVFQGVAKPDADSMTKAFGAVLEKMTGQVPEVTVLATDAAPPESSLVLRIAEDPKATEDAFRIRTEGGRVVITARAPMGLRFGFYQLMERLGCKFWAWDDELIPSLKEVKVGPVDEAWIPPFRMHDLLNREAMTPKSDFVSKIRGVSPVQFTGNHNIQSMLKAFAEANPKEVFPLVKVRDKVTKEVTKEVREFNNLHYCYTAPGIAEALAAELEKEVIKRKGDVKHFIYFAGMGDWYGGMCECERCQKIYDEETWTNPDEEKRPGYTATLLRMVNKAAEILEAKYPGIQVGTFAYMSLEAPPAKTVPRDNVSIYVPRLRHSASSPANAGGNRGFWLNLERWCQVAKDRVDVWEYGANYANFIYPYPVLYTMAESIKAYRGIGLRGLMIQGNYASMGGDAIVMNNWVWSRLMSDPSLDTDKLVQEFTDGYYGPAAPPVREYLKTLEATLKIPDTKAISEFSEALKTYLTPKVLESLTASIAEARKLVSAPEYAQYLPRVNDLAMGVDAARLWKEGPMKERDGRYIRADFGYDTSPEAFQLWKNNRRGTTPTELSSGRAKWLDFLSWHGGPVAKLSAADLIVKIWPAKAGTVGPVMLGPAPVILRTYDQSLRFAEFEAASDPKAQRFFGDGGVGAWDDNTKNVNHQEIRLLDNSTIRIDYYDQRVSKAADRASVMHAINTAYPVRKDSQDVTVAYRDTAGTWHDVPALPEPGKGKEIKLSDVMAWRVTTPKAVVTDEIQFVAVAGAKPDINVKRPHLSGWLGINTDGNLYTVSNLQLDDASFDEPVHTMSRTIKIEKQP